MTNSKNRKKWEPYCNYETSGNFLQSRVTPLLAVIQIFHLQQNQVHLLFDIHSNTFCGWKLLSWKML